MASPQPLLYPQQTFGGGHEVELQQSQGTGFPVSVQQVIPSLPSETTSSVSAAPHVVVAQLQVSVPSGCQAGQALQFTPPGHTQPLSVVMQQEVIPGSTVTVQYPIQQQSQPQPQLQPQQLPQQLPQQQPQRVFAPVGPTAGLPGLTPQASHFAVQQGSLPPAQLQLQEEDDRGSNKGWFLFGAGCCCCLFCSPLCGPPLWVAGAALYYCKPAEHRARLPRSRVPALTSLITCIVAACCALVFAFAAVGMLMSCMAMNDDGNWTMDKCQDMNFNFDMHRWHHHHDWHHRWHHHGFNDGGRPAPPSYDAAWINDNVSRHGSGKFFEVKFPLTGGAAFVKKPAVPRAVPRASLDGLHSAQHGQPQTAMGASVHV